MAVRYDSLKDFDKAIEQRLLKKVGQGQIAGQPQESPLVERLRQIAAERKNNILRRPL